MSNFDIVKRSSAQPDRVHSDALYRVEQGGLSEKMFDGPRQPSGPVLLDVSSRSAYATVHVNAETVYPTVRVYTHSTNTDVIQAVKETRIELDGQMLIVEVPDRKISSTVIHDGGNTIITGGNVSFMSVGRNATVIGGSGSINDLIRIEVALPEGSGIQSDLHSGNLTVFGALVGLEADSSSGDILVKSVVDRARVRTSSGDVRIARIASGAEVRTSSGDIWVGRYEGTTIDLSSSSGDMDLTVEPVATGPVRLRTSSGDITLRGARGRDASEGGSLRIKTRTSSGDVRRF